MYRAIKTGLFLIILCLIFASFAVDQETVAQKYIRNFKEHAIKEMLLYGVPASITLAQGMLESDYGTSTLATLANNHFGIKCHMDWEGPTFRKDDDKKDECFRKYSSVLDSYTDHSVFLKTRSRYAELFKLDRTDYISWARGLKKAGYATDPKYAQQVISLIEKYKLNRFDNAEQAIEPVVVPMGKKELPEDTKKTVVRSGSEITKREILSVGITKYIIVQPGDTFKKIAMDTDKDLWQLYKYNDLTEKDKLVPGQKMYLQPKRRKAKEDFHIVKKGDTMKAISQLHCIKLKTLYKKNNMKPGEELKIGEKLYLRKSKSGDSF